MKKRRYILLTIVCILLVLLIGAIYLTRPVKVFHKETNETDITQKVSLTDMLGEKLMDSAMDMLSNGTRKIHFEFTEDEVNRIILGMMEQNKSKEVRDDTSKDDGISDRIMNNVDGIHCEIKNGALIFYLDTKLFSSIPIQVIMNTNMTISDQEFVIYVDNIHLGRLPINKKLFINTMQKKMKSGKVDAGKSTISIPIPLPNHITIEELEVQESIKFHLNVSIKSISDVMDLFEFFRKKE